MSLNAVHVWLLFAQDSVSQFVIIELLPSNWYGEASQQAKVFEWECPGHCVASDCDGHANQLSIVWLIAHPMSLKCLGVCVCVWVCRSEYYEDTSEHKSVHFVQCALSRTVRCLPPQTCLCASSIARDNTLHPTHHTHKHRVVVVTAHIGEVDCAYISILAKIYPYARRNECMLCLYK